MTTMVEPTVLHPVEVDLLCELAEVRAPFPLRVPSVGTTLGERRTVFAAARRELAGRGLAGERGPRGVAATFVRLLRAGTGAVHLVVTEPGAAVGAVMLVDDLKALLATQAPEGGVVRLVELGVDDAVRELCALAPAVAAGGVPAFTLPLAPMRGIFARMNRPGAEPMTENDVDDMLLQSGVDERLVGRLVTTMQRTTGGGQAGMARWHPVPACWRRCGESTHWVDTGRGRFQVSQSADGLWASVNPFSRNDVRAALRELGARARDVSDEGNQP